MTRLLRHIILALCAFCAGFPVIAYAQDDYMQCVPFARETSGIPIYGDAHTWWGQAEGKYERGNIPVKHAVMAFRPHGAMELGHVATVAQVVDSRTVLLDHANWSTIDGRRGHIERGVKAIDISPDNDWSVVRVWYTPIGALGGTAYPIHGFIYPGAPPANRRHKPIFAKARKPSRQFLSAMASYDGAQEQPERRKSNKAGRKQPVQPAAPQAQEDPIGDLLRDIGA